MQSARENYRKPNIILDKELKNNDEQENMPILLPPQAIQEVTSLMNYFITLVSKIIGLVLNGYENLLAIDFTTSDLIL